LGSEGSFGGGPAPGLINWNEEVLCLYHASTGNIVYAYAAGATPARGLSVQDTVPIKEAVKNLPDQHWILQTEHNLEKGLSGEPLLKRLEDEDASGKSLALSL
jgi:hypothetical protein